MSADSPTVDILLEDGPLLAVNKPAGLLTLGAIPGVPTLEREVKAWLKARFDKPGNVYLGIPHRLDRPVSGVVVFARNSKTAARLAEQFRERQVRKVYWALVEGTPKPPEGELVDWLLKAPDEARVDVVPPETPGAREARLKYRTLSPTPVSENESNAPSVTPHSAFRTPHSPTWLEIELLTGRMHQIRVQLASRGWPVVGDVQYGATTPFVVDGSTEPRDTPIALHARSLTLRHPIRYDEVTITAPVPATWERFGLPMRHDK
jgi:23S rRNA pseudouridine1911/1915/1917 synthase